MDAKFNREQLMSPEAARGLVTGLVAASLLWLAVSVPVGLYRSSKDSYWCKGFGHPGEQCIKERRAERWGPFNAWGTNGSTNGTGGD